MVILVPGALSAQLTTGTVEGTLSGTDGKRAGRFLPNQARQGLIVWNNLSPRAGFAWHRPHSPLAGRYLDFGNPNSIGGSVFQWIGTHASASFQPGGQSSSDEFNIGAEYPLAREVW